MSAISEEVAKLISPSVPYYLTAQQIHPPTACCNYIASAESPYPVMWNQLNQTVQCHACGTVFEPRGKE